MGYEIGETYNEKVNFFASTKSKDNESVFLWYFMDENGNLIKFVKDKGFVGSKTDYEIKFTVNSVSPIKGKSTSLISAKLWSVQ